MRHFLLPKVAMLLVAAAFVAATATAQGYGPGGGGSYGPSYGGGYGGASGMSGGPRSGMMRNGYGYSQGYGQGQGYGPAGGYPRSRNAELTFTQAMRLLQAGTSAHRVDRARKTVTFTGTDVSISMGAVQPTFPDTTFEVAGLVDPTIVVPTGSTITLSLVNMDYGSGMDHGVELTTIAPPYPVLGMMGMPDVVARLPILGPRSAQGLQTARYPMSSTVFQAPPPGVYYYLCQYYDHASRGMYGKLIVSGS